MDSQEIKIIVVLISVSALVIIVLSSLLLAMKQQYTRFIGRQQENERKRIEALEHERGLIAADLHDDMGPMLSAVIFKLGEVDASSRKGSQLLNESRDHIDTIIIRMREISSMLVPRSIERKGPLVAIAEFSNHYLKLDKPEITVTANSIPTLSAEITLHLYRMLQEIVHNTIKHAAANRLLITGEHQGNKLVLLTDDDGVGFDPKKARRRGGMGLENLEIRASMIGASLTIDSSPGRGTRYSIKLTV